ncbi:MAG TPA: hypothetical protein VFO16_15050 [Pseudonocardiaceae bacterium]|nr:hypothetical protein [Pseudonocardiaceae bacterium]
MISRTPRYVRWSLVAVVSALPLALIAPWQAQAGPGLARPADVTARTAGAVPTTGVPAAEREAQMDDPADAVAGPDPNAAPEPDPAMKGKNNERHRMLVEAPDGGGGKNPNPNCTLIVPNDPLSAQGLATPYQLVATNRRNGPCRENNINQSAFVEATIIDPATGALAVYRPLVIDQGTQPGAPPVVPKLTPGSVVGLWFGFQGTTLRLAGASGGCVNGLPGSPFGQFAYCGAPEFFRAANAAIAEGKLKVPPLGTGRDNQPCPSTRDFAVVDQDQSDNLTTKYLALRNGRTAQDTPANVAALQATRVLKNASDNGLLSGFIDPALGCTPFTAPDITAGGVPVPSLALNELQAAAANTTPMALIPPNDPMAQVKARPSMAKINLYRAGVNQPPVNPAVDTARAYCTNLATIAPARLRLDRPLFIGAPSPDPAAAKNLFTFLVQRLKAAFADLKCTPVRNKR